MTMKAISMTASTMGSEMRCAGICGSDQIMSIGERRR